MINSSSGQKTNILGNAMHSTREPILYYTLKKKGKGGKTTTFLNSLFTSFRIEYCKNYSFNT